MCAISSLKSSRSLSHLLMSSCLHCATLMTPYICPASNQFRYCIVSTVQLCEYTACNEHQLVVLMRCLSSGCVSVFVCTCRCACTYIMEMHPEFKTTVCGIRLRYRNFDQVFSRILGSQSLPRFGFPRAYKSVKSKRMNIYEYSEWHLGMIWQKLTHLLIQPYSDGGLSATHHYDRI